MDISKRKLMDISIAEKGLDDERVKIINLYDTKTVYLQFLTEVINFEK